MSAVNQRVIGTAGPLSHAPACPSVPGLSLTARPATAFADLSAAASASGSSTSRRACLRTTCGLMVAIRSRSLRSTSRATTGSTPTSPSQRATACSTVTDPHDSCSTVNGRWWANSCARCTSRTAAPSWSPRTTATSRRKDCQASAPAPVPCGAGTCSASEASRNASAA